MRFTNKVTFLGIKEKLECILTRKALIRTALTCIAPTRNLSKTLFNLLKKRNPAFHLLIFGFIGD